MKEKNRFFIMIFISVVLIAFISRNVSMAQDDTFIIERKNKSNATQTSRQLKEELIELLEGIAHGETKLMQGLSAAQEKLLYRIRELFDGDKGPFTHASHSQLKHYVAQAKELRDSINRFDTCVADLNTFLKKQ